MSAIKASSIALRLIALASLCADRARADSPDGLPVLDGADVVVVGGGVGGVAAAIAAATHGARTLLLTSRHYLGEDIAGQLWLWPEVAWTGAPPLAVRLYQDPLSRSAVQLPFAYTADRPASPRHPDRVPPSRLADPSPAGDAQHDSVQYDGDVAIELDLRRLHDVATIVLTAFRRRGDYEAGTVTLETTVDGVQWRSWPAQPPLEQSDRTTITFAPTTSVRRARLTVRRAPGAQRLLLGRIAIHPLIQADAHGPGPEEPPRPMHLKATLESAMREAGARFLFGVYPVGLLRGEDGQPAGVLVATRAGRQAVLARVLVDATDVALVARWAGAEFRAAGGAPRTARWIVAAPEARTNSNATVRRRPGSLAVWDLQGRQRLPRPAAWFEYTIPAPPSFAHWVERARFEQAVRDATVLTTQYYTADTPYLPAEAHLRAGGSDPPECARPRDLHRLWVVGETALGSALSEGPRPIALIELGLAVGVAAANEARGVPEPRARAVAPQPASLPADGRIAEPLEPLRARPPADRLKWAPPPLEDGGQYDVIVVGGGTAGAAAAIAAARAGLRVLVVEQMYGLGGVGTLGMIGKYWFGNRVGFSAEVPQNPTEARMEFYRSELRRRGAELWFGSIGWGAWMVSNRVAGVLAATPYGAVCARASVVIDATGNADIAAAAGAPTRWFDDVFTLQNSHIPPREIGASYLNGDRPPIDAADPIHLSAAMSATVYPRFDRGPLVASRERRRIIGEYTLDWLDQILERTFPDTIARATSDYDSHGMQVHLFFMLRPQRPAGDARRRFWSEVPYRCLLPRGVEGLLVVGLGLSVHRDALPIVRMQPDVQNVGYAAGLAAALAVQRRCTPREIPVRDLQRRLVEGGFLPTSVLSAHDSFPLPDARLDEAVTRLGPEYEGVEVLLAFPDRARPRLRAALAAASDEQSRLACAHVLGVLGDRIAAPILVAECERRLREGDLPLTSSAEMRNPVERLIWALGRCGDPAAVPALVRLAEAIPVSATTLWRALAASFERAEDPAAAPVLKRALGEAPVANEVLRLWLASALLRCGDPDGRARAELAAMACGENALIARAAAQALQRCSGGAP